MSVMIDESRVEAFVLRVVDEIGAAMNVPLTVIGFRLGLYKPMAEGEPSWRLSGCRRRRR